MVGRMFSADGKDQGDAKFWERDMGMTPTEESKQLEEAAKGLVDAALHQAEYLSERNPTMKKQLFAKLAELYPDDPRAAEWQNISEG